MASNLETLYSREQLLQYEQDLIFIFNNNVEAKLSQRQIIERLHEQNHGVKITRTTLQEHLKKLRKGQDIFPNLKQTKEQVEVQGDQFEIDLGSDAARVYSLSPRIRTQEEAIAKANIDMNVWEVEKCRIKAWDMGAKGPDKRLVIEPLFGVTVDLKKKVGWNVQEFRQMLLDDCKDQAPSYRKAQPQRVTDPILGLLCIFDHHFGKLSWGEETGDNYDLKIAEARYMTAAEDLLARFALQKPERLAYVVGNDFLHVDQGSTNSTTRGTLQHCDGRWQKAFRVGLKCAIKTIDMARMICPVDVIAVSGNHDAEKLFCLAEALAGRYCDADDVSVQNEPNNYHYYNYGVNLLGFTHGDDLNDTKKKQLANKMAVDCPTLWSETTCWEWFLGHCHREKEQQWLFRTSDTIQKVVIRECPALCGSDAWHAKNLYMSPLGAELHMYHKYSGRYGYLTHTPLE